MPTVPRQPPDSRDPHDEPPRADAARAGTWAHIAAASLVGNLIPDFLVGCREQRVDSAVAGLLNATTPLSTPAIAFATGTEATLARERVAGFLLGFLGAVLIVGPWDSASTSLAGAIACFVAAASYGVS